MRADWATARGVCRDVWACRQPRRLGARAYTALCRLGARPILADQNPLAPHLPHIAHCETAFPQVFSAFCPPHLLPNLRPTSRAPAPPRTPLSLSTSGISLCPQSPNPRLPTTCTFPVSNLPIPHRRHPALNLTVSVSSRSQRADSLRPRKNCPSENEKSRRTEQNNLEQSLAASRARRSMRVCATRAPVARFCSPDLPG